MVDAGAHRDDQLQVGQRLQHALGRQPGERISDVLDAAGCGPDAHVETGRLLARLGRELLRPLASDDQQRHEDPLRIPV